MSTTGLDKVYERVRSLTEEHLSSQAALSVGMDGWSNEKKQPLKIVSVVDTQSVAFFQHAVDNPGELQDTEAYVNAVEPSMARPNAVGLNTDDPAVMTACRAVAEASHPNAVTSACHWHKIDGAVPLSAPKVAAALQSTGKTHRWFSQRGVPSGQLRLLREAYNLKERRDAHAEERKAVLVPTLKVCASLFTYFAASMYDSTLFRLWCDV